jgi:hypothetical protein
MKPFTAICRLALLVALVFSTTANGQDAANETTKPKAVPFEEIHQLIRQHLADTSDEELNAAAVTGLIEQLKPHVTLEQPADTGANTNSLVPRAERYCADFGYLRVGVVREGLRAALRDAIEELLADGPLKGLVLDLRFVDGTDYAAAAQAAALFTDAAGTLLQVGETKHAGTSEGGAVLIPVMALINQATAGAGEALAAALRHVKAGLIIGSRTAGQATLFEEFTLSNGQTIRIASQPVQLADGSALPRAGLTPDIQVATSAEDDRRYLNDPFWEANPAATERPAVTRRRVTEADLVRQRREGISLQQLITNTPAPTATSGPTLKDPSLVRALDMLKALTVVQSWNQK